MSFLWLNPSPLIYYYPNHNELGENHEIISKNYQHYPYCYPTSWIGPKTDSQPVYAGDQYQKYESNSATPPTDYVPTPSNSNQVGQSIAAPNALGSLVAVFQDVAPWGSTSTQDILTANGMSFEMHTSMEFGTIDFNQFPMIVIAGDQPQAFYDRYATYQSKFENYVIAGGYLNFFACDMGWNGGNLTAPLPGGVIPGDQYDLTNNIIDPAHPLVAGVPNPFTGNYASHAYFTNLVPGTSTIATDTAGNLTLIHYDLGYGTVAAFGQPLEISHAWGWDAGQILTNALTLIAAVGDYVWDDVNGDGVQDPAENGINGILIHLYQDNGNNIPEPNTVDGAPIATTVTANIGGDDGYYRFSDYFVAGGYFIEYVVTPGFTISPKDNHPTSNDDLDSDADPTTGLTDVFIVTPGAGDYSRDVGMFGSPTAVIGNLIWEDMSLDGVQDLPAENGIDGITVNLFYDNGDNIPDPVTDYPIDSTTTAGGGLYQFDFLAEGNYFLEIEPPANYVFSPKNNHPTNDDTLDSDASASGLIDVFFLVDAGIDNTRDAGMVEYDYISITDGNWHTAGTWSANAVPDATSAVTIASGTTVTVDANATCDTLFIEQNGTLIIPAGVTLSVETSLVNQGTIQQTQAVGSGATVEFLHIQDSGASSTRYRGAVVDTSVTTSDLGNVTISVQGIDQAGGEYCTTTGAGSPAYADRCFEITVGTDGAADLTLYGLTNELNGITEANLAVYRFRGTGLGWAELTSSNGNLGSYSFASAQTSGFSHFLLGASGNAPTAIELQEFSADSGTQFLIGTAFLSATLALTLGGLFIWKRREAS